MIRGMSHVIYLVGVLDDEVSTVAEAEAVTELQHALEHWHAREHTTYISDAAAAQADTLELALTQALNEYASWSVDLRVGHLRNLVQRYFQFLANLDRELVGLTNSDPGSSL
jgi:hypothetical protein